MNITFMHILERNQVEVYIDDCLIKTQDINTTKDGKQYIHVPNLYHPDGDRCSFNHRPGDMVQALRDGYGDAINGEHLIRFLNRESGKEMRAKSLKSWEGTEFAWIVCEKHGSMGDIPVTVNELPLPTRTNGDARSYQIKYYKTEEEAQAFVNRVYAELI